MLFLFFSSTTGLHGNKWSHSHSAAATVVTDAVPYKLGFEHFQLVASKKKKKRSRSRTVWTDLKNDFSSLSGTFLPGIFLIATGFITCENPYIAVGLLTVAVGTRLVKLYVLTIYYNLFFISSGHYFTNSYPCIKLTYLLLQLRLWTLLRPIHAVRQRLR